ncbi:MAG: FtsX-like permease family protein [Chloroflexi bacterium]|nr:FtsX-like permease family protein [Chloroflexota bacterium]MBP7042703.1 FtsX-like permease family protein [Chloroflexota bacterium]
MSFFYRLRAIFTITFKRLWAQRSLTLMTLLGLVTAVALIMTVPLYADAVYFRILQEELSANAAQGQRPPFAYLYDYVGSWAGPRQWEDIQAVDAYLTDRASHDLGLPQRLFVRHLETGPFKLFPADTENYTDDGRSLGVFSFATTSSIADHIDVVEGQFPAPANPSPDSQIDVLVPESLATELGLQVGDALLAYDFAQTTANPRETAVRVAGIWRPKDETEDFWFFAPAVFNDLLLVPEETFSQRLSPVLNNEITRAVWYLVLDGRTIHTTNAEALAARSYQVERRADTLLPNLKNPVSPADGLNRYRASAQQLTVLLTAFNVPVIALILAFIGLIVGLGVNQRRNEIAVMRSRGGTRFQIMGFALLEGLLLGGVAIGLGTAVALIFTQLMGKSRSFLDFSAPADLRVALTPNAWQAALVAILLAVVAQVLPTMAAAGDTIITYKQEQARAMKRPWWQRAWLDVLLLIPALYGYYLLQKQGTIFIFGQANAADAPLQNPLLFLIPTLTVFSLTLLFVRLLPWFMGLISWLLAHSNSIGTLLATRQLARTPRLYAMPLMLLVFTASLAVFTASLAQTLDFQLYDESRYAVGADVNLRGAGLEFGVTSIFPGASAQDDDRSQAIFLPLSEYRAFPSVTAVTRVGRYRGEAQVGNQRANGLFLGLDRADFAQAAYWRWDFASYQLGSLLNALATSPDAILVSEQFAVERGLRPGDFLRLNVKLTDGEVALNSQIVGLVSYFPTWYPQEDGPLFVGNLETIFAQTGGDLPYEVWLDTAVPPSPDAFQQALTDRKLFGWTWQEPYSQVAAAQRRPDRQGVFGLLSVGFMAAALLTVLGFFMYALFSLRQRFISLGILRAVGLTQKHMTVYIAFELAFLILIGLTLGTGLGVLVSRQFIPYLQIGARAADLTPPYLVEIAWTAVLEIYLLFAAMFVVALAVLATILRRMRIFQAIKLGETV